MTSLSKPSSNRSPSNIGSTSASVFYVEDRIKITKLRHNRTKGTASLLGVSLDANSDDALDELKCPICLEIPLEEIFQCGNGHPVCKACQEKMTTETCSQCRGAMKLDNSWIRSLPLENILDKMWIVCPFKSKGCTEILSRKEMSQHKPNCSFNEDVVAQICQHFHFGEHCMFQINRSNVTDTLEHFRYMHRSWSLRNTVDSDGQVLSIYLDYLKRDVNYPKAISLGSGENQRNYLMVVNIDGKDECVRFLAINLNKSSAVETETEMELSITILGIYCTFPFTLEVTPFEIASEILEKKIFKLYMPRPTLDECYALKDRILRICYESCNGSNLFL